MLPFRTERRGRYSLASSHSASSDASEGERPTLDRSLSAEEIAQLCKPIAEALMHSTCYDVLGLSTQVVVVEVHAPLHVAFIAAQETKVPQCVLWNVHSRKFAGVMPTTEYIKILLYCHDHPEEKNEITKMSIEAWMAKSQNAETRPLVAARADDTLHACFSRMNRLNVRRSLVVAEKEGNDISLIGIVTQEMLLKFLATTLFSLDPDATGWGSGTLGADESAGSGNSGVLPQRVMNIVLGVSPTTDPRLSVDDHSGLAAAVAASSVAVGPYRNILDVRFVDIPELGKYRATQNKVTMQTPVEQALRMLIDRKVHSVAVVDDYDIVIDVVSRTDVMRMETNGMYDVTISVAEAISFHVGGNIFAFYETDTIRDILIHFAQSKVRELYLVDPRDDKLLGQLSMSELLKFLFRGSTMASDV